ncbi:type II toxin-antitoxin system HicB family antitoxin [Clostridium vitabionis]|uniref:type II toxin-antitoxin system HicB family antitoxin n=1 Tax=Clostridium vitabionis TaxID=2784388 RepID=UPI00188CA9D2|nr:type II toxin-antitoxin system HicB family antitoxin [Clostridium vitabionis]
MSELSKFAFWSSTNHGQLACVFAFGRRRRPSFFTFESVVDDYLADCEEEGVRPEKAYKGSFNVRVRPEIHQKAAIYSINHGESLNRFVEEAIEEKLARTK